MTQNEKDILLKDHCSRLPYGVKVQIPDKYGGHTSTIKNIDIDGYVVDDEGALTEIEWARPYLFPLSSMTKEQYEEWCNLEAEPLDEILTRNSNGKKMSTLEHHLLIAKSLTDAVNYCYKNHFDIYGLIPMGLAIDATGLNIY